MPVSIFGEEHSSWSLPESQLPATADNKFCRHIYLESVYRNRYWRFVCSDLDSLSFSAVLEFINRVTESELQPTIRRYLSLGATSLRPFYLPVFLLCVV